MAPDAISECGRRESQIACKTHEPCRPASERRGPCAQVCGSELALGEATAICPTCGAVHHGACWERIAAAALMSGAHATRSGESGATPAMTIMREELAAAEPLPARFNVAVKRCRLRRPADKPNRRWNRTAVAAFVVALLGIPLFGLITGLVAIVIACVALAGHSHGRRGMALAVIAIVVGLFDVTGLGLRTFGLFGSPHSAVALDTLTIDPESLDDLPDRIRRAMRANVVIESVAGLGRSAIGSGVIMRVRDGMAHIVTNRHTVDLSYTGAATPAPKDLDSLGNCK